MLHERRCNGTDDEAGFESSTAVHDISRVVHLRNLPPGMYIYIIILVDIDETGIKTALSQYGPLARLLYMTVCALVTCHTQHSRQCLVEFVNIDDAEHFVSIHSALSFPLQYVL